jgi:hypothetical protein
MHKPFTCLVFTYAPTYLPIYETYFLQNWLLRWNQIWTQMRFIHNWVIRGIQWMVCWWVLVHGGVVHKCSMWQRAPWRTWEKEWSGLFFNRKLNLAGFHTWSRRITITRLHAKLRWVSIFFSFAHVFRLLFVMGVGEVEQCGPKFERFCH